MTPAEDPRVTRLRAELDAATGGAAYVGLDELSRVLRLPRASLRRALAPLAVGVGHHRRYPVDEAARALVPQESAA